VLNSVVAATMKTMKAIMLSTEVEPVLACRNDQISAKVAISSSETMNRSDWCTLCHSLPSERTSTRILNQNQ
jgi:hypothetical protein